MQQSFNLVKGQSMSTLSDRLSRRALTVSFFFLLLAGFVCLGEAAIYIINFRCDAKRS
jgi:hypothetical protein